MISIEAKYEKSNIDHLYRWKNKSNKLIKYSNGVIYRNRIITCFHGTNFAEEIIIDSKKIEVLNTSPEVDLTVLSCPESFKKTNIEPSYDLSEIDTIKGKINVDNKELEIKFNKIIFKKIHGPSSPTLPYISGKLETTQKIDYHGLSGSGVVVEDKLIGIIDCLIDEEIIIIPTIVIDQVIDGIESFPILPIYGRIVKCKDTKGNAINGVFVSEHSPLDFRNNKKSKLVINDDDILISLNGISLNESGYIYSNKLKISIPLESYIALFCIPTSKITLEIFRKKQIKGNSVYELMKLNLHPINSNLVNRIPIYISDKKYIIYKNLVLCELDEYLLNHMKCEPSDAIKWYHNKDYYNTNKFQRIVVIIDIIKDNKNKDLIDLYQSLSLDKILGVVSRIHKKNVVNLETIEKTIKSLKTPSLTIRLDIDKVFTISYVTRKNKRLRYIKKPI